MKQTFLKLLAFVSLVACIDFTMGQILTDMVSKAKNDEKSIGRVCKIVKHTDEDVLIFGSSRASHHYVPEIITDSLGMSCYNCGMDGRGVVFWNPVIKETLKRYTPKLIILDITSGFDIKKEKDYDHYLTPLKPLLGESPIIDSIYFTLDSNMKIKNLSSSFKFNSLLTSVISSRYSKPKKNLHGYMPLNGMVQEIRQNIDTAQIEIDTYKLRLIKETLRMLSKQTNVIVCTSPYLALHHDDVFDTVISICESLSIPLLNHTNDEVFIGNKEMFRDQTHLNDKGASLFTSMIIKEMKSLNE